MLTIPKKRIQNERLRRGWSQEQLAEEMTRLRRETVGDTEDGYVLPDFTHQQVYKIEGGRCIVKFDDNKEPLWWALAVLGIPPATLVGE